jgi:hypothetical protein
MFLHIQHENEWPPHAVGEIVATNTARNRDLASPLSAADIERERLQLPQKNVLATGEPNMSYLLRPTMIGPSYSEWTKLGALIDGDTVTLFVDDREVATVKYPGLREMYRIAPAMLAPRETIADDVACDFDYFQVKRLPVTAVH